MLTLAGAEPRRWPWKQSMAGPMRPLQKRLLLHVRVSSTVTSSSFRVGDSSRPFGATIPQPARLHRVPGAGSRLASGISRRVLLRVTVPSSCGRGTASDTPLKG